MTVLKIKKETLVNQVTDGMFTWWKKLEYLKDKPEVERDGGTRKYIDKTYFLALH